MDIRLEQVTCTEVSTKDGEVAILVQFRAKYQAPESLVALMRDLDSDTDYTITIAAETDGGAK